MWSALLTKPHPKASGSGDLLLWHLGVLYYGPTILGGFVDWIPKVVPCVWGANLSLQQSCWSRLSWLAERTGKRPARALCQELSLIRRTRLFLTRLSKSKTSPRARLTPPRPMERASISSPSCV